jgi:Co/Zn/Cd efflux system component
MFLNQLTVAPSDVDEALQEGGNLGLLKVTDDRIQMTRKGKQALGEGRLHILHTSYYMWKLMTERVMLIISVFVLVVLAGLQMWMGLSIRSDAMFFDGVEKLTDLTKVGIIGLSLRYQRDRLAAIVIIILMALTGGALLYGGLLALLAPEPITVTVEAYLISALAILSNAGLVQMKTASARMSGNLALLSDAKDNSAHIKIALGVATGLTFAFFGLYFVDSLVALAIACVILSDAIITLKELVAAGEDISVDTIRLGASAYYDDKITDWVLARLTRGPASRERLNAEFLRGLARSYRYYNIYAVFGHHRLQQNGIYKHLDQARRSGLVDEQRRELVLTKEGLARYYYARAKEFRRTATEFAPRRLRRFLTHTIWIILAIVLLLFLLLNAGVINQWLATFPVHP